MLDVIFIILGIVLLLNFIKAVLKSETPLKKAIISMIFGVGSLAAASLIAALLGSHIAVNIYTVFISLTLGTFGVLLIIMMLFFI